MTDIYDGMDAFNGAEECWVLVGAETHRGNEFSLWRWGSAPDLGKLAQNGRDFFMGDFTQASNLWLAATGQK